MSRQATAGILSIAAALARIRGIRRQRVGVIQADRVGGGSLAGATPKCLRVRIAGPIEGGIATGRAGLSAASRRQRRTVINRIGFDAGVGILILPTAADICQRHDNTRYCLACGAINAGRTLQPTIAGNRLAHESHEKKSYKRQCPHYCARCCRVAHSLEAQLLTVFDIGNWSGAPVPVPPEELHPELTLRIEGVQVVELQLTLKYT